MGSKASISRVLSNRHDFLFLFDLIDRPRGGDLSTVPQPSVDQVSGCGFISDASLKRQIRNFVEKTFLAERGLERDSDCNRNANRYQILLREGRRAGLEDSLESRFAQFAKDGRREMPGKRDLRSSSRSSEGPMEMLRWLCREFYDIRAFGCVLSHGHRTMKGSAWGQLRGPVQLSFGRSLHPVLRLPPAGRPGGQPESSDSSQVPALSTDRGVIPGSTASSTHYTYGLYAARGYVSPSLAARTGFTEADLTLLFASLMRLFEGGPVLTRGGMVVRGLYDFEHIGTQPRGNSQQNRREAQLGCAPSQDLFGGIEIALRSGRVAPFSFADYQVTCLWEREPLPAGVQLHKRHEALLVA